MLVSGHLLCCGVFLEHATSQALFTQLAEAINIDKSSNIARQKSLHSFLQKARTLVPLPAHSKYAFLTRPAKAAP